jgi:hypothetical protein
MRITLLDRLSDGAGAPVGIGIHKGRGWDREGKASKKLTPPFSVPPQFLVLLLEDDLGVHRASDVQSPYIRASERWPSTTAARRRRTLSPSAHSEEPRSLRGDLRRLERSPGAWRGACTRVMPRFATPRKTPWVQCALIERVANVSPWIHRNAVIRP